MNVTSLAASALFFENADTAHCQPPMHVAGCPPAIAGSFATPTLPFTFEFASDWNTSQAKPQLIAKTTFPAMNSFTVSPVFTSAMFFFATPWSTSPSHMSRPFTAARLSSESFEPCWNSLPWLQ